MFGKPQIDLSQIRPTSKLSLKLSCLAACGNNVDQANKLYQFIAGDMEQLPDFDAIPLSTVERFKVGANDLFGWVGRNKESLIEGWNLIQTLRGGTPLTTAAAAASPPANVPPIPQS